VENEMGKACSRSMMDETCRASVRYLEEKHKKDLDIGGGIILRWIL
jgi:hypothetical protein